MLQNLIIAPSRALSGELHMPADKSITHRALILSAISSQDVFLKNWLQSLDCIATLNALHAMGINYVLEDKNIIVHGVGLNGLQQPVEVLDLQNSGTGMRLLTGILVAQKFNSVITGDRSLTRRPMRRILEPLRLMGAQIFAEQDNFAPLTIHGGQSLSGINYSLPVASAQVKSAILLAGLYASGETIVREQIPTRNHTELMLEYFRSNPTEDLILDVPRDISAAAFYIVGASIKPGSDVYLPGIGINPTRTGIIQILTMMGADIKLDNIININNELRADIIVKYAPLHAVNVPIELVPNAIDEFPILAIAAACAKGTTIIRGAQELRYKESDRIKAIAEGLTVLGIKTQVFADGLAIRGGKITGGLINSYGDHRIGMAFAIAGLVAQDEIIIQDTHNIATSFPGFVDTARMAGLDVQLKQIPEYA